MVTIVAKLIRENRSVYAAMNLEQAEGGNIDETDLKSIRLVLGRIPNFDVSNSEGELIKFDGFPVVVISGRTDGREVRMYLVRFDHKDWAVLARKTVRASRNELWPLESIPAGEKPRPSEINLKASKSDAILNTIVGQLIKTNTEARLALSKAKDAWDLGLIDNVDLTSICSLLGRVHGFKISPAGGEIVSFGHFSLATIPGKLEGDYTIAYLIRIPGKGWLLLDMMEMPEPMVTRKWNK
jgi:hypothetical protein